MYGTRVDGEALTIRKEQTTARRGELKEEYYKELQEIAVKNT